jgi:hypothetical protein
MKKTAIVFVCIILLAAFAYAQNETESNATDSNATTPAVPNITTPPAAPVKTPATPKAAVDPNCNKNKLPDAGENCFNCPSDVKCKSGETCLDTGVCKANINYTTYAILGIGAFLFIGVIIFARRFVFKKPKEEPKPIQQPVQQQIPVAQEPIQLPPEIPAVTPAREPQQPMNQEFPLMQEPVNEHPGETDSQKFIRQMREKGWNDERVRMKLKEAGWSETQIALEFLKAPKFIKKQ